MASITTRAGKGSPLTNAEVDANFTNINTELGQKLTGNQTITLSGDASGSGATSIALTLANSGVTAGTYPKVTVDAKGRVTAGSTLSSGDITSALGYTPLSNATSYLPLSGGTMTGPLIFSGANTYSPIQITGGVAGYYPAVQDGAGRVNWYWNKSGSGVAPTFEVSGEDAVRLKFSTTQAAGSEAGVGVYYAPAGSAGGSISWTEVLGAFHNRFQYLGNTVLHAGNYTSYSPTLTGSGASGTWGISISGSAAQLGGLSLPSGTNNNEANRVVRTDSNGYANFGWIWTASGDQGTNAIDRVYASYDGYIRYYTPANFRTVLDVPTRGGSGASGTWGINITGNAATATSATDSTKLPLAGGTLTGGLNGTSGTFTSGLYARKAQSIANYTTAALWVESYDNTTTGIAFHISGVLGRFLEMRTNGLLYWADNVVLHAGNYTSYSPSLTGSGASGTWAISISGSAAQLNGLSSTQLFNNMGVAHSGFGSGFDSVANFGPFFIQGDGQGPGTGSPQFYGLALGLGDGYPYSSYALQLAIPRYNTTDKYLSTRVREGGSWGSWQKISAGYADSAGSATGNAGSATRLINVRTINGTGFDGQANIDTTEWVHSDRDFPSGTLITTSINYAVSSGDPFVLEIRGNSYGNYIPLDIQYQGYIYYDTIIHHGGYSNGHNISGLVALNVGGNLCFWFPSQGYWNGYNVKAYTAYATRAVNRVTSITGTAKPAGTKEVALSANIRQSLHSGNFNSYAPTLTGSGASGTWGINVTGTAGSISGFGNPTTSVAGNTIVYRDGSGHISGNYIFGSYFNAASGNSENPTIGQIWTQNTSDDYLRKSTPAHFISQLGLMYYAGQSSGNWQTFVDTTGKLRVDQVNDINNGSHSNQPPSVYTFGGVMSWRTTNHSFQLYASHIGDLTFKSQWNNDNYSGWRRILHESNYNSFAPTLTGSGASGTWGINITGSAGSAGSASSASSAGTSTRGTIEDTRAGQRSPNAYDDYRVSWEFTNQIIGGGDWHTAMTMQGWHDGYAAWQIIGPSSTSAHENFYLRSGVNTSWNSVRSILHSGNFNSYALPLSGGTLTNSLTISPADSRSSRFFSVYRGSLGADSAGLIVGTGSTANWFVGHPYSGGGVFNALVISEREQIFDGSGTLVKTPLMYFTPGSGAAAGNVGIGKTNPTVRLDVDGAVAATSMSIGGNTVLHAGNYNSYAPTLTGGNASGTWTININGSAAALNGYASSASGGANVVLRTDASGYLYLYNWINTGGGGLFSSTNSAHWKPNDNSSYGTWYMSGSRNGYTGINCNTNGGDVTWMIDMGGNLTGWYNNSYGWQVYWSGGTLRCFKNSFGGGTDAAVLDAVNYTNYALDYSSTQTITGWKYFQSNLGSTSGSLSGPPLQVFASGSNAAFMSFHRGGSYAVNFGLDSDNVLRIGGWSASANRLQMDMSGNLTMAGNVTAYSDERLKKDWLPVGERFVERLALARVGSYTRIDSGERQAGVSAQSMREVLPECVSEDADGTLALAYGNAALVSAVELAKELVALKRELAELKSRIPTVH